MAKSNPRKQARIYRGTGPNLARLASLLRAGELVAVPTETVYGLAADAFSISACKKIFAAKGRPSGDPLIVHIRDHSDLARVAKVNPIALRLAKRFWPGPLTIVLPKTPAVPAVVTSGRPSVAVRMPAHRLFRRLLKLAGRPLAAPSANPFGYLSPTTADHVRTGLGRKIRHILDGGPSQIGVESTIVDLRDPGRPRVLRPGKITRQELEQVAGVRVAGQAGETGKGRARHGRAPAVAPGQFPRHYSPHTPVQLHRRIDWQAAQRRPEREAWLFLARPPAGAARKTNMYWLDPRGLLPGAARRLYIVLRRIDQAGFDKIHAEMARAGGMGDAINDRLRRAAGQNWGED